MGVDCIRGSTDRSWVPRGRPGANTQHEYGAVIRRWACRLTQYKLSVRTSRLAAVLERAGYEMHAVVNFHWLQMDTFGFIRDFGRTLFV